MRGGREDELIERVRAGSERAFRELVESHTPLVYSVVTGIMGNRAETDDTVQEVFIKVFGKLPTFRGESKLSTWIYRIARNEALNARQRFREKVSLDEAASLPSGETGPDERYARNAARHRIGALVSRLDEHYRMAIELRYMGEKSYEEIAEIMEIPIGTVKTYIHRAKAELRQMLMREGKIEERKGYEAR